MAKKTVPAPKPAPTPTPVVEVAPAAADPVRVWPAIDLFAELAALGFELDLTGTWRHKEFPAIACAAGTVDHIIAVHGLAAKDEMLASLLNAYKTDIQIQTAARSKTAG